MANFLRDYITNRGEDTVIRTQFGILDKNTGEHLVPVQHADEYFSDMGITIIANLPNQGTVVLDEPEVVAPPTFSNLKISGIALMPEASLSFDGTVASNIFTADYELASDAYDPVEFALMSGDSKIIDITDVADGSMSVTVPRSALPTGQTFNLKVVGKAKSGDVISEEGESDSNTVKFLAAPTLSTNITTAALERYQGESLSLAIVANPDNTATPITYKWLRGTTQVGTAASFNKSNVTAADSGSYKCEVTDALSRTVTSNIKPITVYASLAFSTNIPNTMTVATGDSLSLEVVATGGKAPITYKWFLNNQETGVDTAVYNVASVNETAAGTYRCEVTSTVNGTVRTAASNNCVVTVS